MLPPINFKEWIEENRHLLKPPVGNKIVYEDTDFIIMVVGGPNTRKDYHLNEGEEFFYQVEGDIVVKTMQDGKNVDIPIKEGEIFLLPPNVPHSPQRPANTVGLVVERARAKSEDDGLAWFCESCGNKLYEERFHLDKISDIANKLPVVFENFYDSEERRTCDSCGAVMQRP